MAERRRGRVHLASLRRAAYAGLDIVTLGRGVRRRIGGESIRFPPRWCRYYASDYEPATFAFLRAHCHPGNTALDIGAHLGLFTILMARRVGPAGCVFSFEPAAATRSVLAETVRLNRCADIARIQGEAVAERSGTVVFYETGDDVSNANSIVRTERGSLAVTVTSVSIDDFVRDRRLHVHCMKIDVEGAELGTLRGGRHTIGACRPSVHLSLHPAQLKASGGSLREIWDLTDELGMVVTRDCRPAVREWFCAQGDLFDVGLVPRA